MAVERLSVLDSSFLSMETSSHHMHVGGLGIFEAGLRYADVIRILRDRIDEIPNARKRVREHNAVELSGTAIGFVNGMVTGAGALYQPLLGWLLDLGWTGEMAAGARLYDAAAYRLSFSVLVAGAIAGLVCAIAMRETYCRQRE